MSTELSTLIKTLRTYEPLGMVARPQALGFITDYVSFVESLEKIDSMIGLIRVKKQIASQVKTFIVNYKRLKKPTNGEKLHTLLYGPPGCGKTELGKALAKLWASSGCLPPHDGKPLFVKREVTQQGTVPVMDNEKINLKQSLAVRESQLRQTQDKLKSIKPQLDEVLTLLNNIRKKTKAREENKEGHVQARYQELKTKLRVISQSAGKGPQVLPVTLPKNPNGLSLFGTAFPSSLSNTSSPGSPIKSEVKFTTLTRGDIVAMYQGHTTARLRDIFEEYAGGVIMIDEAYSLCTSEHDSFGKEALTEIINFMTTYPDKIIFIFAGYRHEMEESVLRFQPGLARRFNWSFEIDDYTSEELFLIFTQQLAKYSWALGEENQDVAMAFFEENKKRFPHFGGDTERLCLYVRETCDERNWQLALNDEMSLTDFEFLADHVSFDIVEEAFKKYIENSVMENTLSERERKAELERKDKEMHEYVKKHWLL